MQNQTSLQETTIKEETEGLGIEYTNYSPDYSLYQRDYVATGESEPVETGRSRYRIQILFVSELLGTSKKRVCLT